MTESSQISNSLRHRLGPLLLRLVIGSALLVFVFTRAADLRHVVETLRQASIPRLLLALVIAATGEVLTAWKWALLVRSIGGRLPLLAAVRASFIGMFYNNYFPGSVGGDVVRVLLIARYAGGKARATASAFMQRNTGVAGLFAIGIPAAFLWPRWMELPGDFLNRPLTAWLHDARAWLIGAALGYAAVNIILFSRGAYDRLWALLHRHITWRPAGFFLDKIRRFHTELHGFRFWLAAPLAISAATQLLDIFMVWNLAAALNLDIPFHVLLVAVPLVTLANLLPITINGIGLREAMYVALLTSAAIPPSHAVALSLMQFGVIVALAMVGGILQTVNRKPNL
jgi:uncharacterized membrane protein YbhN (UPF0104 family)